MDKLKAENLHGGELILLTGDLVTRYNACLNMIGETAVDLPSFSIDGIGWSPEIAELKNDIYYLNNGEANPHAIIVSPLQEDKPVYVPFHSFDREVMKLIFEKYRGMINDITKDSGLCVDLDQYIDAFYEPFDLLRYKSISIGFRLLNDLDKIQQEQLALVELFNTGNNFIDENLHMQLLASARKFGDLRKRNLKLTPIAYETTSFYTRAFGGVFVLRGFIRPIMIFESRDWYNTAIKDTVHDVLIYFIKDDALLERLLSYLIISHDHAAVIKTERYRRVKKSVFASELGKTTHETSDILEDQILFKSYLNKLDIKARNKVMNVERYYEKLARNEKVEFDSFVDKDFFNALYKPHSSLEEEQKELIWKLLVKISPKDPLHLYWYDKMTFYETYKSWKESYQVWVIDYIKEQIQNMTL